MIIVQYAFALQIGTQVSGIAAAVVTRGLCNVVVTPKCTAMWDYPKSPVHQAAIDAMKPERDREAAKSMAAQMKLRRTREAVQAIKDSEVNRLAVLAKTARLRAARLALAADAQTKKPLR